jgi:hypothetical protein
MFSFSKAGPSRDRNKEGAKSEGGGAGAGAGGHNQKTRFEPSQTSSLWASFRKHLSPATHPSTTSQSGHGSAYHGESDIFYLETNGHLPLELLDPIAAHSRKKRSSGGGGAGASMRRRHDGRHKKSSAGVSGSRYGDEDEGSSGPVSVVVVENDFAKFRPSLAQSDSGSTRTPGGGSRSGGHGKHDSKGGGGLGGHPSLFGKSEEGRIEGSQAGTDLGGGGRRPSGVDDNDATSMKTRRDTGPNWIQQTRVYEMLVGRVWPNLSYFLDSSYSEPSKERSFMKEVSVGLH